MEDRALRGMHMWLIVLVGWVVSLAVGTGALGQVRVPAGFPLQPETETVSFDFVKPKEVKQFDLWFTNTSDEAVTISKAQPSCPCMVTSIATKVVAAGERGKVVIIIEGPENEIGPLSKKFVNVFVEGIREPAQIWVSGELTHGARVLFDGSYSITGRRGTLVVESVAGESFRVLGVGGEPAGSVVVEGVDGEARVRHELDLEIQGKSVDTVARWVIVETDLGGSEVVEIRADISGVWRQWRPIRRWKWHTKRERVDDVRVGEAKRFSAVITGMKFEEGLAFELASLTPGVRVVLVEAKDPPKGQGVEVVIDLTVDEGGVLGGGMGYACVVEIQHGKLRSGLDVFGAIER